MTGTKTALVFLISALACLAAGKPPAEFIIPTGAAIFVDSNNGFEVFMLAAFQAKQVPLRIVSSREKADYVLDSAAFHSEGLVADESKKGAATHATEAAIKLTERSSGEIVWAYAVNKGWRSNGNQSIAESCAKHLKDVIRKGPPKAQSASIKSKLTP